MLMNTFLHIDGIGQLTESLLWNIGILNWKGASISMTSTRIPRRALRFLEQGIPASVEAMETGDTRYFAERLTASEMWRIWSMFRERACFLDIETTGLLGPVDTTVVCLSDWKRVRLFVRGENLHALPSALDSYDLIVTFNGKTFDLPRLREEFPGWKGDQAHLDLLYPLRRSGQSGGLKSILRRLGMSKPGPLRGVDGWMAPLLWREYQKGNEEALETLKAYTVNDVVHLPRLADYVYNEMIGRLPLGLPALQSHEPLQNPHETNEELIQKIRADHWWLAISSS